MFTVDKKERTNNFNRINPVMPHELEGKKWDQLFKNENELIEALKVINVDKYEKEGLNGYQFIKTFQSVVSKGNKLTSRQIIQLKRLAKYVYCYKWNVDNAGW